jgi:hypothetical protein
MLRQMLPGHVLFFFFGVTSAIPDRQLPVLPVQI